MSTLTQSVEAMKEEAPKALVHSMAGDLPSFYGSTDRGDV